MGVVSPLGTTVETFWESLVAGRSAVRPAAVLENLSGNRLWAAVGDDFARDMQLPAALLRNTARFTQYALVATAHALEDARLPAPPQRTATFIGSTMGGFPLVAQAQTKLLEDGPRSVTPKLMALVIPNMAAAHVAMHWRLHGPQLAISTACASSIDAVGVASRAIARGEVDVAIAGGTETLLAPLVYQSLVHAGALSRNPNPALASRPFDAERDGFIMGDGAAILVLEDIEHARRRGARVHAVVRGYGSVADAYHITSPEPSAAYEMDAMREAFDDTGELEARCDVVYAHATSTPVGDAAEARAIANVYGEHGIAPVVTSIKGHLGHSMAAAGAMSIVAGVVGMHEGIVPPTLGTRALDSSVEFDVVMERARVYRHTAFAANAFGFGGQNASLVVAAE